jgi:metal-dependent amidase/aminoacylase/carboxypeptidase family protein
VHERRERTGAGSTDFGNVSHRVPAVCAYLGICGPEAGWHTKEVAEATRTERGHAAIIAGAKGLAMTTLDILTDAMLRAQAQQEHQEAMAS